VFFVNTVIWALLCLYFFVTGLLHKGFKKKNTMVHINISETIDSEVVNTYL